METNHNHDHLNCSACIEREKMIEFYKKTGELKNVLNKDAVAQISKITEVKNTIIESQEVEIHRLEEK